MATRFSPARGAHARNARWRLGTAALVSAGALGLASCSSDGSSSGRQEAACSDFYSHANAAWIAATPVPADGDEPLTISTGLAASNQAALIALLEQFASRHATLSGSDKVVADMHLAFADVATIERLGTAPLAADLAVADGAIDAGAFADAMGRLLRRGVSMPVRWSVATFDTDERTDQTPAVDTLRFDIERAAPSAIGSGADSESAYAAHVARTFRLLGESASAAAADAARVLAVESRLDQLRTTDPSSPAGPFDVAGFLVAAGVPTALAHDMTPAAMSVVTTLQAEFGPADWQAFLRWRVVASAGVHLPAAFVQERASWPYHAEDSLSIEGLVVDPALQRLAAYAPRHLDRVFGARVLPADLAARTQAMTSSIRQALHRHIDQLAWADTTTRERMHLKLDTTASEFPGLDASGEANATDFTTSGTALENVRRAADDAMASSIGAALQNRTTRTTKGDAWYASGAAYNRYSRSIVVPVFTLQSLDRIAQDEGGRYGALGSVIAHEFLHMFPTAPDLVFDSGLDMTWFSEANAVHVSSQAVEATGRYEAWAHEALKVSPPVPRFIGEDLSDLGSVGVALEALRIDLPRTGWDSLFSGYARSLRTRQSPANDRSYVEQVPAHALYSYRVNAPLANLPAFAQTYGCRIGDPMVEIADRQLDLW